jgi:hypothetical protein
MVQKFELRLRKKTLCRWTITVHAYILSFIIRFVPLFRSLEHIEMTYININFLRSHLFIRGKLPCRHQNLNYCVELHT